ncbi:MAG: hypothetical protein WA949_07320 [Phormidesmis sp.]
MEPDLINRILEELQLPKVDLSGVIAEIHIYAFRLERLEPGLWWDVATGRPRLLHPNIAHWMAHYGFASMDDLPPAALITFRESLRSRLEILERGLSDA